MKITLAIPSHENIPFGFAYDMASLSAFTVNAMPEGVQFAIHAVTGTYVHKARQELVDVALADGVDYILWLDSDMRFPKQSLVHLFQHDVGVVGINYAKRELPTDFVALKKVGTEERKKGERLVTDADSTGLEEVEGIGFGMVLMKTSALKGLERFERPWFRIDYLSDGRHVGEDIYFCNLLRELGEPIYVDHDLSKACSHIGQFKYEVGHAVASREAAEEEAGD